MYVTPLNFNQVLDRFYHQYSYDLMLLFVSSFDGNDRTIIREILDNARRIDRITGSRICFFYFISDLSDSMSEKLVRWVKDIPNWKSLYGEGVSVTMDTADDICRHFGLLRSTLPAFILINKDRREEPHIFTIQDYNDLESFLTPLNILHSYIEDCDAIKSRYQQEVQKEENKDKLRKKWIDTLRELETKKEESLACGLTDQARKYDIGINKLRGKLEEKPVSKPHDEYKKLELEDLQKKAIDRLTISLNSHEGESLIDKIKIGRSYSNVVLNLWELVRTKRVRLSRIIENIRYEIQERGFNVFISCKSQDYGLAHDLYDFLVSNGFKPFLADSSIKEVGIDQYTALIGEVINACQYMVVFATDVRYLETPYVAAEWHTFINDINTGHKPNAKIVSVLSPDINPHCLPIWLRDKQCFTTESFKYDLIHFLNNRDNEIIERLKKEIDRTYYHIKNDADRLLWHNREGKVDNMFYRFMNEVERDRHHIVSHLDNYSTRHNYSYDIQRLELDELSVRVRCVMKEWEDRFRQLAKDIEQYMGNDEEAWHEAIHNGSTESIKSYLEHFPHGIHHNEAIELLEHSSENLKKEDFIFITYSPSTELHPEGKQPSKEESMDKGAAIDGSFPMIVGGPIGAIIGRIIGRFCGKNKNIEKHDEVYSSIFAPSEVKHKSHMLVQIYLHLYEETEKVKALAQESQKDAERRDYIPLQCKLKKGDKVDVLLNIYGETLLMSDKKSVVWQGSFTKCSFDYYVPKDIDVEELSCAALLSVNGVPVGDMRFITQIVDAPRQLNPEIMAHKYNKVFISYSHQDESKVKFLHEGLELGAVPHFFDRKYLKAGDVFPQVIQDYINSADLFILCWSENACKSEYVQKERLQALERAFPKVQPENAAKLRLYPISIEPRAELPGDMKNYYHFGEI